MLDWVRLKFDWRTVRLPNVRLRSIGKMFLWVRLGSITEPDRTRSNDWVRLGLIRLGLIGFDLWGLITERSISYAGIIVRVFPKSAHQPNEKALTICYPISRYCFRLMRDWKLENLPNGKEGRDPFNQNFRKFRSKTEWIGSVQPEKFRKKWSTFRGGPLFLGWTGPIEKDRSIWPFQPILNPRTSLFGIFHVQNGGKYLSLRFYRLLTADVSVLLVHPCTVTTGL